MRVQYTALVGAHIQVSGSQCQVVILRLAQSLCYGENNILVDKSDKKERST
jgi:hypothetical protein